MGGLCIKIICSEKVFTPKVKNVLTLREGPYAKANSKIKKEMLPCKRSHNLPSGPCLLNLYGDTTLHYTDIY